eukprot:768455-Hanusia_phi.AAC.12
MIWMQSKAEKKHPNTDVKVLELYMEVFVRERFHWLVFDSVVHLFEHGLANSKRLIYALEFAGKEILLVFHIPRCVVALPFLFHEPSAAIALCPAFQALGQRQRCTYVSMQLREGSAASEPPVILGPGTGGHRREDGHGALSQTKSL